MFLVNQSEFDEMKVHDVDLFHNACSNFVRHAGTLPAGHGCIHHQCNNQRYKVTDAFMTSVTTSVIIQATFYNVMSTT